MPYLVRAQQAQESGWTRWKSNCPRRWTFWPAPCAPATPLPSAWKCSARRWPIRWARSSARCSTSRTWARRSIVALRNFADRVPLLDVRFFTSSVLLQKQTGGNLSEILSRLAYVIRERFRLKGQVKAASAHGRLTATILTLCRSSPCSACCSSRPAICRDGRGSGRQVMIGGAIVAQILGNFFIKKIINIKV